MGVEPDDRFERSTVERARERGWKYDKVPGDMRLVRALVNGPWDEADFLVIQPGFRVRPTHDGGIVGTEEAR
jgi:hypothetical protein